MVQDMAVGENLRYLFGVGYHPTIVFFKGFWDVHRGTGVLTNCHIFEAKRISGSKESLTHNILS